MRVTSLKSKITLFTLAIFLASIWSWELYVSRLLQQDMQKQLGEQQFSVVSFIVATIEDHLQERIGALEILAGKIDQQTLSNGVALQSLLLDQDLVQSLFSGGLVISNADGIIIAEVPLAMGRVGVDLNAGEVFTAAMKERKTLISSPTMGTQPRIPLVGIVTPIVDSQGQVIGGIVGMINLLNADFLSHLSQNQYGVTGSYYLVAQHDRLIMASTRQDRIMQPLAPPGQIPAVDRFVEGDEGTQVYMNQFGEEVMNSVKFLSMVDWAAAASISTAEAFAPIHLMQQRTMVAALLLSVLASAATSIMLKYQLTPLFENVKTLALMSASDQPPQPLPIVRNDEIGTLIAGFNHLLGILSQREAALLESKKKIRENEALFRMLTEDISEIVWREDADLNIIYISPADERLRGFHADEVLGRPVFEMLTPEGVDLIREAIQNGGTRATLPMRCKDGRELWMDVTMTLEFDAEGKVSGYHGIGRDVTERRSIEEQIKHLAFYDPLTQLPNRRMLNDRLAMAMAASTRSGLHGAVMLLDLDNFKPLNDEQGHAAGDLLLIEVARRLNATVREVDTVARLGGDEFVVVLSNLKETEESSRAEALEVAEKIRVALEQPYLLHVVREDGEGAPDQTIRHRCSCCVGVALFMGESETRNVVLKRADDAMYQAKQVGRNAVRYMARTVSSTTP
ncbi:MAG: diguanylate cyclase [Gammaproteobacteria bacterium]|nr:diguanylate cyclase [Gammaproteobacteria bacterium]